MVGPKFAPRRALTVAAAGLAAVAAGCSSTAGNSSGAGYVEPAPGISQFELANRVDAPQLSGTTIAGKAYSTSYKGHVTVINVWGSWCVPCREEGPSLSEVSKRSAPQGVQFLGIDTLDNDASALAYESHFGIAYPSLADPDQTIVLDLKSLIPSEGVPSTLIIDRSGKVAVRAIGALTEPQLQKYLTFVSTGS